MSMNKLTSILSLGRIKFLCYSPILYTLGAAIATFQNEKFNILYFILGQITVWITHMMTHFYNEYYDFDTDSLNENPSPWTGGSRILPQGILSSQTSMRLAIITTILSLGFSLLMPSFSTRIICWVSLILSWGYSAPPLALSRKGLGELDTAIVLNILTPLLGFVLQNDSPNIERVKIFLLVILPLSIIEYIRMMVMNVADIKCDAAVGKETLSVKIGMDKTVKIHAAGMVIAYLSLALAYQYSEVPLIVILLILSTAPLGFLTTLWVYKYWQDSQKFFPVPFWASTHNALAALSALLGFIISQPLEKLFSPLTQLQAFPIYLYLAVFLYFYFKSRRSYSPNSVEVENQKIQSL